MVYCASNNTCFNATQANNKDNYFWMPAGVQAGNENAYSMTGGSTIVAPLNGNLVDLMLSNGCYDPATNDWHILAGSPCIDKGLSGNRKDSSAIITDVDGLVRTLGAAPDIGCSEKQ